MSKVDNLNDIESDIINIVATQSQSLAQKVEIENIVREIIKNGKKPHISNISVVAGDI